MQAPQAGDSTGEHKQLQMPESGPSAELGRAVEVKAAQSSWPADAQQLSQLLIVVDPLTGEDPPAVLMLPVPLHSLPGLKVSNN